MKVIRVALFGTMRTNWREPIQEKLRSVGYEVSCSSWYR